MIFKDVSSNQSNVTSPANIAARWPISFNSLKLSPPYRPGISRSLPKREVLAIASRCEIC